MQDADHRFGEFLGSLPTSRRCRQTADQFLDQLWRDHVRLGMCAAFSQNKARQFFVVDREARAKHVLTDHLLAFADGDIPFRIHGDRVDAGPFEQRGHGLRRFLFAGQVCQNLNEPDAIAG